MGLPSVAFGVVASLGAILRRALGVQPAVNGVIWTGLAGDGLWSTAGNWEGGKVPSTRDTAILTGSLPISVDTTVSISGITQRDFTGTATQSADVTLSRSFHLMSGSWAAGSHTLTVGGNFTVSDTSGAFQAGTGSVVLNGAGGLSNPNAGSAFYNLTTANTKATSSLYISHVLTIGPGTFVVGRNAASVVVTLWLTGTGTPLVFGGGTLDGVRTIADGNGAIIKYQPSASGTVNIAGGDYGDTAISFLTTGTQSNTYSIQGNMTGLQLMLMQTPSSGGHGTWTTNNHDMTFSNFSDVGAFGGDAGTNTVNFGSSTITVPGFCWFTGNNDTINFQSCLLKANNWGTFGPSAPVLNFGTSTLQLTGDIQQSWCWWTYTYQPFYNLTLGTCHQRISCRPTGTLAILPGAVVTAANDSAVGNNPAFITPSFTAPGTALAPITMLSQTPGSPWTLRSTAAATVHYVTVTDSHASTGAAIDDTDYGVDGGGNTHWTFPSPFSTYLRPDGVSEYLRPDGTSLYVRP